MEYEEKLNLAKKALESGSYDKSTIEYIFPELKESENERVKRILYSISSKMARHMALIFTEEEFQCFDAWSNAWIKERCNKTVDKSIEVKPKFNVGDWAIIKNDKIDLDLISFDYLDLNSPLLITDFGVDGQHYKVEDVNGKSDYLRMEFIENRYHLWTLEDAKDGDVLTHSKPTSDDFDYIFIYNKTCLLQAYGYYSKKEDRAFVEDRSHYCPWNMDEVIMPATKKQRVFLRPKLGEIHFEWDGKNKIFFHMD